MSQPPTPFDYRTCEEFQKYPWITRLLETIVDGNGAHHGDTGDIGDTSGHSTNLWESSHPKIAPLSKLITSIAEKNIFGLDDPDDLLVMHNLGLRLPSTAVDYSTPQREYLYAQFLFRYRILDVGLWCLNPTARQEMGHMITRIPLPDTRCISQFKKLWEWQKLISSAQLLCTTTPGPVSARPELSFKSACLKHVGMYIERTEMQAQDSIFINFDAAALYLSHLLEGFADLNRLNAPQALLEQLDKEPAIPFRGIKAPLHLALAVSPLVLLIPTNHVSSSCGRVRMLEIWKALGSNKPESISMVEREIWSALFDLSLSSDMDTRNRLHQALDNITSTLKEYPPKQADLVYFYAGYIPTMRSTTNETAVNIRITQPKSHNLASREEEEEEEEVEVAVDREVRGHPYDKEKGDSGDGRDGADGPSRPRFPPEPDSYMNDDSTDNETSTTEDETSTTNKNVKRKPRTAKKMVKKKTVKSVPISISTQSTRPQSTRVPETTIADGPPKKKRKGLRNTVKQVVDVVDLVEEEMPYPAQTLKSFESNLKVTASHPTKLYGCNGKDDFIEYTPTFHYQEHMNWFDKLKLAIERSYVEGYPHHLVEAEANNSIIKILDYQEFKSLSAERVQAIFAKQHIVVKNYPCNPTNFDEKGLATLTRSSKPITIQDMSVLPESNGDERHVIGVTRDLLRSHLSMNGKILNALDFPMPMRGPRPPESLATDVFAYNETLDDPYCKRISSFSPYPFTTLYWGLAATSHSFHFFHIDSDGFGTFITPQTGKKYWVLATPKKGQSFAATDIYVNGKYAIDQMNENSWDVEGILLTPGTCLFMRPNTPHLVLTPDACICHGGHFYATSTLRNSCHGLLHAFIASSLVTNTEHTSASRDLLRRLLLLFSAAFQMDYITVDSQCQKTMNAQYRGHIPDIFTFQGLIDVLSLCILMEIGHIIHYKSYTDEGLSPLEKKRVITGRACSCRVRRWLSNNIEVHHAKKTPSRRSLDEDVFYPLLASQLAALLHYKRQAPSSEAQGIVDFSFEDLVKQINAALFSKDDEFIACYKPSQNPKTFDWIGQTYKVLPVDNQGFQDINNSSDRDDTDTEGENEEDLGTTGDRVEDEDIDEEVVIPRKRRHNNN